MNARIRFTDLIYGFILAKSYRYIPPQILLSPRPSFLHCTAPPRPPPPPSTQSNRVALETAFIHSLQIGIELFTRLVINASDWYILITLSYYSLYSTFSGLKLKIKLYTYKQKILLHFNFYRKAIYGELRGSVQKDYLIVILYGIQADIFCGLL